MYSVVQNTSMYNVQCTLGVRTNSFYFNPIRTVRSWANNLQMWSFIKLLFIYFAKDHSTVPNLAFVREGVKKFDFVVTPLPLIKSIFFIKNLENISMPWIIFA